MDKVSYKRRSLRSNEASPTLEWLRMFKHGSMSKSMAHSVIHRVQHEGQEFRVQCVRCDASHAMHRAMQSQIQVQPMAAEIISTPSHYSLGASMRNVASSTCPLCVGRRLAFHCCSCLHDAAAVAAAAAADHG